MFEKSDDKDASVVLRRKAVMVVYAIEVGFIEYLNNNKINYDAHTVTFGEVLQLITSVRVDDAELKLLKELKNLSDVLEISSIRNSCAHPTREFNYYQWYRLAAFASDYRFKLLNILEPYESLACAESGSISDPPEEWVDKLIPPTLLNNLPNREKYDITGLIGRNKEVETLIKDLKIGRTNSYALIGPGGVGKTSIAVDVCRQICEDYSPDSDFNSVIFVTLKYVELTASGQVIDKEKSLSSIDYELLKSINEVYGEFHQTIDEALFGHEDDKVLLLLDNLEEVILKSFDEFYEFVNKIPANWRILMTSRITVDGVRSVPIRGLTKPACEMLGRKYFESQTGKVAEPQLLIKLSDFCSGNPLAIKLLIDRLSLGCPMNDAMSLTQNDILDFSFKALVEALTEIQRSILECIFVAGEASRQSLFEVTALEYDSLVEALTGLSKTSLIEISEGSSGENYLLSSSIRDLIARVPLNFDVRNSYSEKIRRQYSVIYSYESDATLIDITTFALGTPQPLRRMGQRLPKIWVKTHNNLINEKDLSYVKEFESEVVKCEGVYGSYPDFFRLKSYSRAILKDFDTAIKFACKAIDLDDQSLQSMHLLGSLYMDRGKYPAARTTLESGVKYFLNRIKNGDVLEGVYANAFVRDIFSLYFKSYLWERSNEDVIRLTESFSSAPAVLKGIFIASRASAIRRNQESNNLLVQDRIDKLVECVKLIKYGVAECQDTHRLFLKEAAKLNRALSYFYTSNSALVPLCDALDDLKIILGGSIGLSGDAGAKSVADESVKENVEIYVHSVKLGYLFAHDLNEKQYFVPYTSIANKGLRQMYEGDKLIATDLEFPSVDNKAIRVNKANFVDKNS